MSVKTIDKIATQGIKRDNDGYTTSYSCQYKLNIDDEFKDVVDDKEEIVVSLGLILLFFFCNRNFF